MTNFRNFFIPSIRYKMYPISQSQQVCKRNLKQTNSFDLPSFAPEILRQSEDFKVWKPWLQLLWYTAGRCPRTNWARASVRGNTLCGSLNKGHHEKTKYMIKSWDHIVNLLKTFKITVWVSGDMRYTQKLFADFFVLISHSKANSRTTTNICRVCF